MNKPVKKEVPITVVRRLPRYYRYLEDLLRHEIFKISSKELSKKMGVTASQIRQDLNFFGGFGQQGYGYNVENLYYKIQSILGIDRGFKTIIVGAGNICKALANYEFTHRKGFFLTGIFDVNPDIVGKEVSGCTIQHFNKIEAFLKENQIDIAILTVPKSTVNEVADKLYECGMRGFWNFSNAEILKGTDAAVENVYLNDSLLTLSYKINELSEETSK